MDNLLPNGRVVIVTGNYFIHKIMVNTTSIFDKSQFLYDF
jgi:hypothetical protein